MSAKFSVDKLFRVTTERTVDARGTALKFWLRTLGASANAYREQYAIGAARSKLALIRREGTLENETYMLLPHQEHRDELIARALLINMRRLSQEVAREFRPNEVLEPPEFPTITEIVEAEDGEAVAEVAMQEEVNIAAKSRLRLYEEELQAMNEIDLVEEVVRLMVDGALSVEYNRASDAATLYNAVFSDAKFAQRFFESPQEVGEADPALVDQLLTCYAELDVFSTKPDELKN
jgi:hypothetical protein